jgi:hypothetical protein
MCACACVWMLASWSRKCPHKSVITKSYFLRSLPGREETSIFSQTRRFSFLLCYRQASKRVAIFQKETGVHTRTTKCQMWWDVGSRAIIYLLIIHLFVVSCWVARDNLLYILYLFVCRIQQDVRSRDFILHVILRDRESVSFWQFQIFDRETEENFKMCSI